MNEKVITIASPQVPSRFVYGSPGPVCDWCLLLGEITEPEPGACYTTSLRCHATQNALTRGLAARRWWWWLCLRGGNMGRGGGYVLEPGSLTGHVCGSVRVAEVGEEVLMFVSCGVTGRARLGAVVALWVPPVRVVPFTTAFLVMILTANRAKMQITGQIH